MLQELANQAVALQMTANWVIDNMLNLPKKPMPFIHKLSLL